MANDFVSEYILKLGGDPSGLQEVFQSLKSKIKADIAELESRASKMELFGQIETDLPKVQRAFDKAKESVRALRAEIAEIKDAGAVPTRELATQLQAAEKAAAAAGRELKREQSALQDLTVQLGAAGVNTRNLTAEQTKLAKAIADANAAAAQQAAKDLLGFKSIGDVKPQIDALTKAFDTLKASGKLSASEIATAQVLLTQRTRELEASVTDLGTGFKVAFAGIGDTINKVRAPILAVTAALAGTVALLTSAVSAAKEFQTALGQLGAATNLSKEQLAELGEGARAVAREFGFTVAEAQKALFDVIRSGVPPNSALFVLREAAQAARAEFGNLDDSVKASDILLSAYGESVTDLRKDFDILITSYHNGGVSIAEFGANAGKAAIVARGANVDFETFIGLLETLRKNGLDAGESFSALERVLVSFGDARTKAKLDVLSIDSQNLVTALRQIGERRESLNTILDLGLTSGKSAAGVQSLTTNADQLVATIDRLRSAAGAGQKALADFFDTPAGRAAAFGAALDQATINLGEIFGPSSIIGVGITKVLDAFNLFNDAVRQADAGSSRFAGQVDIFVSRLLGIPPAAQNATRALQQFITDDSLSKAIKAIDAQLKQLQDRFTGFSGALSQDIKDRIDALARSIEQLNAGAQLAIDALDKRREASAQTAEEIIAIEKKLVDERDALLKKATDDVLKADQQMADGRKKIAAQSGEQRTKLEADATKASLANVQQLLAGWTQHYQSLTALAQAHQQKLASLENERFSFNQRIEQQLFDLRLQGLSPFDQYLTKVREVERLAGEARAAGGRGDIERAKTYTEQALSVISKIDGAISTNGNVIVSQDQALRKRIDLTKSISDIYNETLQTASEREKAAIQGLEDSALLARAEIELLRGKYRELVADLEKGLTVKFKTDEASFNKVADEIAELTKTRTVLIEAKTVNSSGFRGSGATGEFNLGGLVGRAPQRFAEGGAVWRVPGVGNSDTVPALLREGSFVLRKSSVQKYGDLFARPRRFAVGGIVNSVIDPGVIAQQVLSGSASKLGDAGNLGFGDPELHRVKVAAEQLFASFADAMSGLKPSSFGQDYSRYLADVLRAIELSTTAAQAHALFDPIAAIADSIRNAAQAAKQFGAALAYWPNAGTAAFQGGKSGPSDAFLRLGSQPYVPVFVNGGKGGGGSLVGSGPGFWFGGDWPAPGSPGGFGIYSPFAKGGPVGGDTVPALLTPGEFVFTPSAVKSLGVNFLSALNRGLEPPRAMRFAGGGVVPGGPAPTPRTARFGAGAPLVGELHLHGAPADFMSEASVQRFLVPTLQKIERRSRRSSG